jgi:hypothetical protein
VRLDRQTDIADGTGADDRDHDVEYLQLTEDLCSQGLCGPAGSDKDMATNKEGGAEAARKKERHRN